MNDTIQNLPYLGIDTNSVGYSKAFLNYKEGNIIKMDNIRVTIANFINELEQYKNEGADGRLIALAETSLEEACMWAIKAINK